MADTPTLTGARVLVVGASAGIGRAFARHAVAAGARVCVSSRRYERLVELCGEAGGGHPVAADLTDAAACARLVDEAVTHLGGLDLVMCSAGHGALAPLADTDAEGWRRAYDVNVVGPMLVSRAALPVLSPDGVICFLSSESAAELRWGLGAYAASKAALDTAVRQLRHEHPERRIQRVVMGATMPTEFGDGFDPAVLDAALARWAAAGVPMGVMETDEVGRHLVAALAVVLAHPGVDVPDLRLAPRGAAADD